MRRAAMAALLSALLLAGGVPAAADPSAAPLSAAREADLEERLGGRVRGELAFTDMEGRPVRLASSFDGARPVILVMAYYRCPMLCGLVLKGIAGGLAGLDLRLDEDYRALTVSFDPRDTPEAAARKREGAIAAFGGPAGAFAWPFLVGSEAEGRALADDLGFRYAYDERTDQYAHPAAAFVLTPDGRISRYLYGVAFQPRDLRLALIEAGEGRIGTIVDRVLMTCYRYDPASRRYAPYFLGFVRLGGGATVALVSIALAVLWRRERRRKRPPRPGPRPAPQARTAPADRSTPARGGLR